MKIVEGMEQGSPQWRSWRRSKVTATDAAPILNLSPYKTQLQVWRDKLGLEIEQEPNEAMKEGHRLEPIARAEVSKLLGVDLKPVVVEQGYLGASLDGISQDHKIIVEIKAGPKAYSDAEQGLISQVYRCQCMHQMALCDVEKVFYYAFNGTSGILLQLHRDEEFIKTMLEAEKAFWQKVQDLEMPEPTDRDYVSQDTSDWHNAASFWIDAKAELKKWEQIEDFYRQKLLGLAEGRNSVGSGVKLTKVIRRGAIEYAAIPQLIGLDLEPYRKKVIESWRITET